jgi:hypothetical protein
MDIHKNARLTVERIWLNLQPENRRQLGASFSSGGAVRIVGSFFPPAAQPAPYFLRPGRGSHRLAAATASRLSHRPGHPAQLWLGGIFFGASKRQSPSGSAQGRSKCRPRDV